jgi:hypothetical protein
MAESIIIHFSTDNILKVEEILHQQFIQVYEYELRYPMMYPLVYPIVYPIDNYLIMVSPYKDFDNEYDNIDKEKIIEKMGLKPSLSYDFEIRRSKSDEACDLLESFIRNHLHDFNYLVDDMQNFLSKEEIKNSDTFLDLYRYEKGKT